MKSIVLFFLILSVLAACTGAKQDFSADLFRLTEEFDGESIKSAGNNAQEFYAEKQPDLVASGLAVGQFKQGSVILRLSESNASIQFNPLVVGLPEDWKPFSALHLGFSNQSEESVKVIAILWGPRGRLPDTLKVHGKQDGFLEVDLHDLPLIGSPKQKYTIEKIELLFDNYRPAEVVLNELKLVRRQENEELIVVDAFGQRKSRNWEGKVKNETALKQHLEEEQKNLLNAFDQPMYDKYAGFVCGKSYPTNGYFSVAKEKLDGKEIWFFVTPEGNPFWSFGVTGVRPKKAFHGVTLVKGNEHLFEYLPDKKGTYADAYIDSAISFYQLNLLRKYENNQGWRDMSLARLKSWGINTIGNWAEDSIIFQSQMPFTWSFETEIKKYGKDPFSPEWQNYIDSLFVQATIFRENPYLLGYFVDNEGGWNNLGLPETLPENAALRAVWKDTMTEQFGSLEAFNVKQNTVFSSWNELISLRESSAVPALALTVLDSLYAEKYFQSISEILNKYDPNHLYLGCRFTRKLKPGHILRTAGKYCDVITVNVYSYEPIKEEMDAWHQMTDKPILIGEHQAALNSPRQLPLRWQTFTHEERNEYFVNYVRTWAEMPFSLGSHWYQYTDQDITGRMSNGENQIIGFVDITDQPYQEMIDAARFNSQHLYKWHGIDKIEFLP